MAGGERRDGRPLITGHCVTADNKILTRGELGLAARSSQEWYQALERLYQDGESGARMGANGREVVKRYYSVSVNAKALADIFQEVVES